MATTTVNIHDAKTQLSKLIERAERGEDVVMARAGKPVVRLTQLAAAEKPKKRESGFVSMYNFKVPDDLASCAKERSKRCSTVRNEASS